jgi:hypothetical protein
MQIVVVIDVVVVIVIIVDVTVLQPFIEYWLLFQFFHLVHSRIPWMED